MATGFDRGIKRGGHTRGTMWAKPTANAQLQAGSLSQHEVPRSRDSVQGATAELNDIANPPKIAIADGAKADDPTAGPSDTSVPTVTVMDVEEPRTEGKELNPSASDDPDIDAHKRSTLPSQKNFSLAAQLTASVSVKVSKEQSIQDLVNTAAGVVKTFRSFRKSVVFEVKSSLGNIHGFDLTASASMTASRDDCTNSLQHEIKPKVSLADELNAFLGNEGISVVDTASKTELFKCAFANVICVASVPDDKKSFCLIVASDYHADIPGLGFDDDECLLCVAHVFKIDAVVKKLDVRDVVLAINAHVRRSTRKPKTQLLKGETTDDHDVVSIAGEDAAVSAFRRSIRRASRRSTKSKSSEILQTGEDDVSVYGFDGSDSDDSDDYENMGFGADVESVRSYSVRGWSPEGSMHGNRTDGDALGPTQVSATYINTQVIRDEHVQMGHNALNPTQLVDTVNMQTVFDMRPVCNTRVTVSVSPTKVELHRVSDGSGVAAIATGNIMHVTTGCTAVQPALSALTAMAVSAEASEAAGVVLLGMAAFTAEGRMVVHVCAVPTPAAADELRRCIETASGDAKEAMRSDPTLASRYQQSSFKLARRRQAALSDAPVDAAETNTDAHLAQLDHAGRLSSLQTFNAVHVGGITVDENLSVDKIAGHAVKKSNRGKEHSPVVLLITDDQVHVMDVITSERILCHEFRDMLRVTVDERKSDHVVVEAVDKTLGLTVAHVYKCAGDTDAAATATALHTAHHDALARMPVNPFSSMARSEHPIPKRWAKFHISRHTLTSKKVIGAGQFGQVLLSNREGAAVTECAVKLFRPTANAAERESFFQECKTMTVLSEHPHICQMLGFDLKELPWLLVLEYICYGDLRRILVQCRERAVVLKESEQLGFAMQIANGLEFVASKGYIHLDIAARNILVGPENLCKVADFGLAQSGGSSGLVIVEEQLKLPVRWLAPEAITTRKFSEYSDCWAFGVTVWEIFSYGDTPFEGLPADSIQEGVCDDLRLPQPVACSDPVYDTLLTCWHDERKLRPRFEQLLKIFTTLFASACAEDMYMRDIGEACTLLQLRTVPAKSLSWARAVVQHHGQSSHRMEQQHEQLQYLHQECGVLTSNSDDCNDFDDFDALPPTPASATTATTSINHSHTATTTAACVDHLNGSTVGADTGSSWRKVGTWTGTDKASTGDNLHDVRMHAAGDDGSDGGSDEYIDVASIATDRVLAARQQTQRRGSEASLVLSGTNSEQDVTIDDVAHSDVGFLETTRAPIKKATARRKPHTAAVSSSAATPPQHSADQPSGAGLERVGVAASPRSSLSPPPTHAVVVRVTTTVDRTNVMKVILPPPSPPMTSGVDQVYNKDSERSSERRRAFWAQGLDAGSTTSSPAPSPPAAPSTIDSGGSRTSSTLDEKEPTLKRGRGGCCAVQ